MGLKYTTSLQDRLYALDPLLGAQVRSRIEQLCARIEDLEARSDEPRIEELMGKLAESQSLVRSLESALSSFK
jgi:BMFP domain-containing protein YqiC